MTAQLHPVSLPLHRGQGAPTPSLRRAGQTLWRVLESIGRARARSEMNRLALRADRTDPVLAARLREAVSRLA